MNSKRLLAVALMLCAIIIFLFLSGSTGHTYFYLSRTGWAWGMREDFLMGADGKLHKVAKSFSMGPLVFAYSYGRSIIDTNSPPTKSNPTRQSR